MQFLWFKFGGYTTILWQPIYVFMVTLLCFLGGYTKGNQLYVHIQLVFARVGLRGGAGVGVEK